MSGLRRTLGKRVRVNSPPGVRIPPSPPYCYPAADLWPTHGGVAHLGERLNGIQEVVSSILIISTKAKNLSKLIDRFFALMIQKTRLYQTISAGFLLCISKSL